MRLGMVVSEGAGLILVRLVYQGALANLLASKDFGASLPSLTMTAPDRPAYSGTLDFLKLLNRLTTVN